MWSSDRRQSISRYKTPVGGGLIGLIAMIGMAIVLMIGSNFARQFLSLAIPAGGAVALVLYWAGYQRQKSTISFLWLPRV
jgi:multisubunit Na+/H+ antiporter MnhB subunit